MSRNRRGHRGGRKHHHSANKGPRTDQMVFTPDPSRIKDEKKTNVPAKPGAVKRFFSALGRAYVVCCRFAFLFPCLLIFNIAVLALWILGARKFNDDFATFWDLKSLVLES